MITPIIDVATNIGKIALTEKFMAATLGECYLDFDKEFIDLAICKSKNDDAIFYNGIVGSYRQFVIRLHKQFHKPVVYIHVNFSEHTGTFQGICTMCNAKRQLGRQLTSLEVSSALSVALPYLCRMYECGYVEIL